MILYLFCFLFCMSYAIEICCVKLAGITNKNMFCVCFEEYSWGFRGEGHRKREMRPRWIPDCASCTSGLHTHLLPDDTGMAQKSIQQY